MLSKNSGSDEKRKFTRINSHFTLEVTPSSSGAEGTGLNVSQGGVLFFHKEQVKIGQLLSLNLRVPGFSGDINVRGKVVRCESAGSSGGFNVAVSFIDLDLDAEMSIREMLETF